MVARIPMIIITTMSSIRVNAGRARVERLW